MASAALILIYLVYARPLSCFRRTAVSVRNHDSGDISLRGSSADMTLANGSGDIIVVQEGNTRAAVTTRSGDVSFHLKNEGEGFAARVSTHGDISFRYGNLKLNY